MGLSYFGFNGLGGATFHLATHDGQGAAGFASELNAFKHAETSGSKPTRCIDVGSGALPLFGLAHRVQPAGEANSMRISW